MAALAAHCSLVKRDDNVQESFLRVLPAVRRDCRRAFRNLPAPQRDEAVVDAIGNAFAIFARFMELRRGHFVRAATLAGYAVGHLQFNRPLGGRASSRDVLSRRTQRRQSFSVTSLECPTDPCGETLRETLADHRTMSPADLAAFRIDFETWLKSLSRRQRAIAKALALGHATSSVARRFGLSWGRISQIRRELKTDWEIFQGERCSAAE